MVGLAVFFTAEFGVVTLGAGVVALALSLVVGMVVVHGIRLAQERGTPVRRGPMAGLGPADRLAVVRAVERGDRVSDPRLAPVAVETARHRQRLTKVQLVAGAFVVLNLALRAADRRRGAALRQAVVFAVFWLVMVVFQAGVDRRARRAEELNAGVQLR